MHKKHATVKSWLVKTMRSVVWLCRCCCRADGCTGELCEGAGCRLEGHPGQLHQDLPRALHPVTRNRATVRGDHSDQFDKGIITVLWDVMLYSNFNHYNSFRWMCCLHLHREIFPPSVCHPHTLKLEARVPPNNWKWLTRLHSVTSYKTVTLGPTNLPVFMRHLLWMLANTKVCRWIQSWGSSV